MDQHIHKKNQLRTHRSQVLGWRNIVFFSNTSTEVFMITKPD